MLNLHFSLSYLHMKKKHPNRYLAQKMNKEMGKIYEYKNRYIKRKVKHSFLNLEQ